MDKHGTDGLNEGQIQFRQEAMYLLWIMVRDRDANEFAMGYQYAQLSAMLLKERIGLGEQGVFLNHLDRMLVFLLTGSLIGITVQGMYLTTPKGEHMMVQLVKTSPEFPPNEWKPQQPIVPSSTYRQETLPQMGGRFTTRPPFERQEAPPPVPHSKPSRRNKVVK